MSFDGPTTLRRWRERPDLFVRECFGITPDLWQDEVLRAFPTNPKIAMTACKGPGKTAVLAWLCWNFLLCYPHPKIAAVSITADNLADNLWPEMAKWQKKSELLTALFTWNKTRIVCNESPETWFMSARSWPRSGSAEQQADTLAGLHADYIMFVLDESGGIPAAVMVAAKAGLSSCIVGHIVQAGNPTHLEGPLYAANTNERADWYMVHITGDPDDPKRSSRVSVEWARGEIATYGRDNPWVLVNVFGKFPPSSINALIGPDEVREAMSRHLEAHDYEHSPKILGVDVAREGDDSSVIFPRQGQVAFAPVTLRNATSIHGAGVVATHWRRWGADAVFIDSTGGFGSGWIDQLVNLDFTPVGVHFAGSPTSHEYVNKRVEMWFNLVHWIKGGGCLPPECTNLIAELSQTTYTFKGDKLAIEPKASIKAKIGRSPDDTDALALTFAFPVASRQQRDILGKLRPMATAVAAGSDFDPYA